MPTLVWLYLTALLYYRTSATCVALAEALQTVSHDRLTRLLQADWSGQTLLELRLSAHSFVWERGYLIIDDTVIPKPFATAIEGLAWVYSSQEAQAGVWLLPRPARFGRMGRSRIPLGMRLWRKGGPSKYALALELLSYARNRLRCRPAYVLFDAWYPSKALLKRIRDYGWYFVCRLKKNRRFNGHAAPSLSAPPLLGGERLAEWRSESLGRQIRRQILCHQPPDAAGRASPPPLSGACANRGSHPRL